MGMGVEVRDKIARRAAKEIQNGMLVNLGIGIPSLVPNHLPEDMNVMFHAENGIVGMGQRQVKGMKMRIYVTQLVYQHLLLQEQVILIAAWRLA